MVAFNIFDYHEESPTPSLFILFFPSLCTYWIIPWKLYMAFHQFTLWNTTVGLLWVLCISHLGEKPELLSVVVCRHLRRLNLLYYPKIQTYVWARILPVDCKGSRAFHPLYPQQIIMIADHPTYHHLLTLKPPDYSIQKGIQCPSTQMDCNYQVVGLDIYATNTWCQIVQCFNFYIGIQLVANLLQYWFIWMKELIVQWQKVVTLI